MKLIFVLPDMSWLYDYKSQFSLGILYLTSKIKSIGWKVEVFDSNCNNLNTITKANVYAFSAVSSTYNSSVNLAKTIKTLYPLSEYIIGGVHISLDSTNIDEVFNSIFIGEAEDLILEYIKDYENNSIKKYYRQDKEVNLSNLYPTRNILEDSYIRTGSIFTGGKMYDENGSTSIMFSRGCPYSCSFCASPEIYHKKVRFRPVDNIISEIKDIINIYNIRQFRVQDDTFTLKPSYVKELCSKLKPLNIFYRCSTRVNHVTEDIIKDLYESGCREIGIGIEVANNEALKKLKKQITIEQAEEAIKIIRKYPITIRCFFMIGLPIDSQETIISNVVFLEKNKIENAVFCNFIPFRGTDMYINKDKYNIKSINENGCMNLATHIPLQPNIERTDMSITEHLSLMKWFFDYLLFKKFIK
jgi:radical SAM superfamily enzyme YgiQ (UPF0313 family)